MTDQKKVLFIKPGNKRPEIEIKEKQQEQVLSEAGDLRSDIKKELFLVMAVCIGISVIFAGIFISDRKNPWIEKFSNTVTSKLISSF